MLAVSTSPAAVTPPDVSARRRGQLSYLQALTSAALIGGSSVATILVGILRNKAMALFIGPAGVGLIGMYGSIADLAQSIAGMGIQSSGVRQIAQAVGSGDPALVSRTSTVLKRVSLVLGLAGGLAVLTFSEPIANLTFGSRQRAGGVALLAVAVALRIVSAGQSALIQGLRRISDLARMNVLAALFSTLVGIPLIYVLREDGVVPSLLAVAAISTLTSWYYSRKIDTVPGSVALPELGVDALSLLKLGFAFMASGFLTMGAAYVVRIIVLRTVGFGAAGLYQAAWSLGGLYVGFVLQAMGADFYPRLTAVVTDDEECRRLVNEQAQISLLLAGPGVIATLAVAPLVLSIFYTAEFHAAVWLLRWICLGMTLRVIAWPLGFIIVARGAQQIFFWTEVAATAVHIGLAWLFVRFFGIAGAGAAFFGLYVWHGILIYVIVRQVSG